MMLAWFFDHDMLVAGCLIVIALPFVAPRRLRVDLFHGYGVAMFFAAVFIALGGIPLAKELLGW